MKPITSQEELFKKLKKHTLIWNIDRWQLSDYHNTSVGKSISEKFRSLDIFQRGFNVNWFQIGYSLKHEYKNCKTFKELKKIINLKNKNNMNEDISNNGIVSSNAE